MKTLLMDAVIIAVLGACASLLPAAIGEKVTAVNASKPARHQAAARAQPGGRRSASDTAPGILQKQGGRLAAFYVKNETTISALLWAGPCLLLGLGIVFLLKSRHAYALACSRVTFFCEKFLLIILAAATMIAHVFFRVNFLAVSPQELWLSPVVFLLASAAFMRFIDLNYPFWNEAVSAMSMPVLASIFVLGWTRLPELVRSFSGIA